MYFTEWEIINSFWDSNIKNCTLTGTKENDVAILEISERDAVELRVTNVKVWRQMLILARKGTFERHASKSYVTGTTTARFLPVCFFFKQLQRLYLHFHANEPHLSLVSLRLLSGIPRGRTRTNYFWEIENNRIRIHVDIRTFNSCTITDIGYMYFSLRIQPC